MTDEEYAWFKAYDLIQGKVAQTYVDWVMQFSNADSLKQKGEYAYKMLSQFDEVLNMTTLDGLRKLGKLDGHVLVWELAARLEMLKGEAPSEIALKKASDILEKHDFEDARAMLERKED